MLVACAFAVQSAAIEPEAPAPAQPAESASTGPALQQGLHPREKKWASEYPHPCLHQIVFNICFAETIFSQNF